MTYIFFFVLNRLTNRITNCRDNKERKGEMAAAARMKNAQTANIAVIGDEDTVTGFLLAGVGAMDGKKDTTYLMVDSSEKQ
jgi:hypothetical protein